MGVHYQDFVIV